MSDFINSDKQVNCFNAWFIRLDNRELNYWTSGRIRILALLVAVISLLIVIAYISGSTSPLDQETSLPAYLPWISILTISLIVLLGFTIWQELLKPLLQICHWADLMRGVNLDARVEINSESDFTELGSDINMLARMIGQLSRKTEVQLQEYTNHISRESRSLTIQYDVASSINISRDLKELFKQSLTSLCENLHAPMGVIRQIKNNNELEVVATFGQLGKSFISNLNHHYPYRESDISVLIEPVLYSPGPAENSVSSNPVEEGEANFKVVTVPMIYRDQKSGVINLFFPEKVNIEIEDYNDLLRIVGQHLGTAIEKYRLDEEESQLLVIKERTRMSHELHDSLAQTIAGLRIQVRVLDEIFHTNDEKAIWHQMERIEFTISEANKQLRELIAHFHVPMNKRGLISSIEESIEHYRAETEIQFYLQNEWPSQELPANVEMQVLRIIQESLANIRRHSKARSVRILLRGNRTGGRHHVLIEDDGVGFDVSDSKPVNGNHMGLTILKDRAGQINGNVTIDSEPGEGTQVNLIFVYKDGSHSELPDGEKNSSII